MNAKLTYVKTTFRTAFIALILALFFCSERTNAQTTFGEEHIVSTSVDYANAVEVGDLDGDGDLDVVASAMLDSQDFWFENLGADGFGEGIPLTEFGGGSQSRDVHIADLDGDGDQDVLVTFRNSDWLSYFENDGNGGFAPLYNIDWGINGVNNVHTSDLDGDGDLDIIASGYLNTGLVVWYENYGDNQFSERDTLRSSFDIYDGVHAADFDLDGDMDVVSLSIGSVRVFHNQGDGEFTDELIYTDEMGFTAVTTGDIDNDGDPDILYSRNGPGEIGLIEGHGDGTFTHKPPIATDLVSGSDVYVADLDNDGDLDVLSSSVGDDMIAWYENLGNQEFGPTQIVSTVADYATAVYAGDMDGDGDIDIISASAQDDKVAWYENLLGEGCTDPGACNFDPNAWIENESCIYEGCFLDADFDDDGQIDADDLLTFMGVFGCTEGDCVGDFNSDEMVNVLDLLILIQYFEAL